MTESKREPLLSAQEYLALEESASMRHEFVNGRIFAMAGGTLAHNAISLNIASLLKTKLRGAGCNVFISDVKLHIANLNSFYYPDVVVHCGKVDPKSVMVTEPVLIFEVLSSSTSQIDRREKLIAYQSIDSLQAYVIVQQSRKCLTVYRRVKADWTKQELEADDELELMVGSRCKSALSVSEIYEGVEFDDSPQLTVKESEEIYSW